MVCTRKISPVIIILLTTLITILSPSGIVATSYLTGKNINQIGCSDEPFHGTVAKVLFSGINNSGMVACPWIINGTDGATTAPNQAFRDYMSDDISTETHEYSIVHSEINVHYTWIYHEFNNFTSRTPDEEPFDPYYVIIRFSYNSTTKENREQWDQEVAPALEAALTEKWYINRCVFSLLVTACGITGFTASDVIITCFFTAIAVIGFAQVKRKGKIER
ncbi:MAG: hypothetical protein ACXAEU_12415 [Candidatus Hodarchaeales archaeon]|jgi:hypothetical protein